MKQWKRVLGAALAVALAVALAMPALVMPAAATAQDRAPAGAARPQRPSLLRPPAPDVLVDDRGATERAPGQGVTLFRWGPARVFGAPVVGESPAVLSPPPNGAVLPGVVIELPWLP